MAKMVAEAVKFLEKTKKQEKKDKMSSSCYELSTVLVSFLEKTASDSMDDETVEQMIAIC